MTRSPARSPGGVLKGLAGTALGGVLTIVGVGGVAAKGGKVGVCHRNDAGGFDYITVAPGAVSTHRKHGDLIDPDLANHLSNCGLCGNVCAAPEDATATCSAGSCGFTCNGGYEPDGAGGCQATAVCTLPLTASCETADQCCADGGDVACGPIGNLDQLQCCRPLGATCSNPGAFAECCAIIIGGGVNGRLVYCAADGTCGGPGASCIVDDVNTCAPGLVCQGEIGVNGQCVAA